MPFGRPRVLQPDQSYCILHHEGFVSAYSHTTLMPLWSSFTIHKPVSLQHLFFIHCFQLEMDTNQPEHCLHFSLDLPPGSWICLQGPSPAVRSTDVSPGSCRNSRTSCLQWFQSV